MASNRIGRINEEMQRELAALIRGLKDPRVQGMISVTGVETTPDLRYAKVYVSALEKGTTQQVLRYTPELHFVEDTAMEQGERIFEILRTLDIPKDGEGDQHAD